MSSLTKQFESKLPKLAWITWRVRKHLKSKLGKKLSPSEYLDNIFPLNAPVTFAQIGANDGLHGDPLNRHIKQRSNWQGLFVEPVPYAFVRLQKNYGSNPKFKFAQSAINAEKTQRTFYYVSEKAKAALGKELPPWYDQLGSFDKEHILKHLDGKLEPYIVSAELNCMPLQDIFDEHQVTHLDLVHIDTEGFDFEVLKQLDLSRYQPTAVLYEHKHLNLGDQTAAQNLLKAAGYEIKVFGNDTLATKTNHTNGKSP